MKSSSIFLGTLGISILLAASITSKNKEADAAKIVNDNPNAVFIIDDDTFYGVKMMISRRKLKSFYLKKDKSNEKDLEKFLSKNSTSDIIEIK